MSKETKRNPFELDTKTVRAGDWPDGWAVTVKKFTYGEKQRLDGLLVAGVELSGDQLANSQAALAAMKLTPADMTRVGNQTLLAGIVGWTFVLPDGSPAPLDEETLLSLPADYVQFIDDTIQEMNPTIGADFPGGSGNNDGDGQDTP